MFDEKIEKMNSSTEGFEVLPCSNKRVYTCKEVQDILGVRRTTVYNLIN